MRAATAPTTSDAPEVGGPIPRVARGSRGLPGTIVVTVEDQGCGIGPDEIKTIFEPFFTTKQGGTGLGLYITHDIVKRHGGNLTVSSEPGNGTRFTVELPIESTGGFS